MKSLKMSDGDIQFGKEVTGIDEFLQRWVNSLKIYSSECYYNENLGLNINIINGIDDAKYKIEHIKEKTLSWFGSELDDLYYEIVSEKDRVIKAIFYFKHKEYNAIQQEVLLLSLIHI